MSWPLVKIKDIAPAKPLTLNGVVPDTDIWQITLDHIESNTGRLLEKNIKPLSEAGTSTHAFDQRYVLYSKLRPYLNKVLLPDCIGIGTTELVPMLPDSERLERKYLAYYLRSERFLNWVSNQTAGAKMPRVSMKVFWEHEIPLPPLPEQKRIAAILDKADQLRQKRQQAIGLADEFLHSVFLDMFGDSVTNPKGWVVREISEVCTDIVDCVNRTAPIVDYETPYKMIRTTNVRNHKINLEGLRCVEKDVYEKWIRRLKPQRGDIIFTREAPAGEAGIIETDEQIFLGQRTMHFRPDQGSLKSTFLLYELMDNGIKHQIRKLSSGSTVTHLSVPECKKFKVRVPPIELQEKFQKVKEQVVLLLGKEQQTEKEPLFNALSQKAFAGEL